MRALVLGILIAVGCGACAVSSRHGTIDTGHAMNANDTGSGAHDTGLPSGDGAPTIDAGTADAANVGHDAGGSGMDAGATDSGGHDSGAHDASAAVDAGHDAAIVLVDAFVRPDAWVNPCLTVTCDVHATCVPMGTTGHCMCGAGYTGDGITCTPIAAGTRVLIYDDGSGASTAGAAATAVGLMPTTATDSGTFDAQFDAGGWSIVVIDSSQNYVPADVFSRLQGFVTGGGRCLFAYWDLDSNPTEAGWLGVSLGASLDPPRPVYPDPASLAPLFASVPTPLAFTDSVLDDGDEVTAISGFRAASFDAVGGASAIAVTNAGRVIVMGFMPYEANGADVDADGTQDMQELWQAELTYVLSR